MSVSSWLYSRSGWTTHWTDVGAGYVIQSQVYCAVLVVQCKPSSGLSSNFPRKTRALPCKTHYVMLT